MNKLVLSLLFIVTASLSAPYQKDYNSEGMIIEDPRIKDVGYSNNINSMPKIIEEDRTYGEIRIKKSPSSQNRTFNQTFNPIDFTNIYVKNKSPKIVFFIDHNFNDSIAAHGNIKNQIEQARLIYKEAIDLAQSASRNIFIERRWEIQDTMINEFLDAGVNLVDRSVIVRLAETNHYKKGNMPSQNRPYVVLENQIKYLKTSSNLNIDMLNNVLEIDALKKYVDFIVEVKISDYSNNKYPTLRARIMNIQDGSIVGSVIRKHEDTTQTVEDYVATNNGYVKVRKNIYSDQSNTKEYTATNSGYQVKSENYTIKLNKYSKDFSHDIMRKFELYFKKDY